jgi:hypothetical protein
MTADTNLTGRGNKESSCNSEGFKDVYTNNGGINAWEGNTSESPAEMGMMLLRGDETPEEYNVCCHGVGCKAFYVLGWSSLFFII